MSTLRESLDPKSWDGQTYFKYLKQRQDLQLSGTKKMGPVLVRFVVLNAAIKDYEKVAFMRQTQQADIERD